MEYEIGFVYNEDKRTVLLKDGDSSVEIYSDVSPSEFELIDKIDQFVVNTSSILDILIEVTIQQHELIANGSYFNHLNKLQQKAANAYGQCTVYQEVISENDSEVLTAQLSSLYKLEKFLKHYFRALTISQSLSFSQRLCAEYTMTDDYLHLYNLVRNTCSTVEYLGCLIESRMGEGKLDLNDKSITAVEVYEEIKGQGLDDVSDPTQEIYLPPENTKIKMGKIALSTSSMEYLWDKRCDIAHKCPLVVQEENLEHLPDDIVSTSVITEEDIKKLTWLSFKLHYHSVSIFINFSTSYLKKLLRGFVEALYYNE
jgi:hypothetical protein